MSPRLAVNAKDKKKKKNLITNKGRKVKHLSRKRARI